MTDRSHLRIIKLPELIDRTGMSRSRIYAAMAEGRFPVPRKLGVRAVGWLARDIDAWIAALPSARVAADKSEAA